MGISFVNIESKSVNHYLFFVVLLVLLEKAVYLRIMIKKSVNSRLTQLYYYNYFVENKVWLLYNEVFGADKTPNLLIVAKDVKTANAVRKHELYTKLNKSKN